VAAEPNDDDRDRDEGDEGEPELLERSGSKTDSGAPHHGADESG
jgi:hypothetical protein